MDKVFVDTVAWIALINRRDQYHAQAYNILQDLRHRDVHLVTTEFVLLEVADALSAPDLRTNTATFLDAIAQQWRSLLTIQPLNPQLYADGWALYKQRPDKGWGLTDCTSFVTMEKERIQEAFTMDRYFEQAGFTKLMQMEPMD